MKVSTKQLTGLKGILPLIRLGFLSLPTVPQPRCPLDMGLVEMLSQNIDYFNSLPVNIPKITILLDHGYHPEYLTQKLEQIYPQIMTKIRFELSTKPSKQQMAAQGKSGESR